MYFKTSLDYTYADNKLTATISDWETYSGVKILVKGLNSAEAANYMLNAKNITADKFLFEISGLSIDPRSDCPEIFSLVGSYSGYVLGFLMRMGLLFIINMPTLPMLISSSGFSKRTLQAVNLMKPPRRRSLPARR